MYMTIQQAEIIIAYADNSMSRTATAKSLFHAKSTIDYQMQKIRENTGKDPKNFYDLCDLLPIARAVVSGKCYL